ncbi:ABC transporter substrate-binding protein [Pseudactinotalea sp. Z1739]|uniref:ABC transporter substrate-binding protein n=1 Tax=Pseudactinotalea sp. Z1739 TaxID=3413028 RepID=UPI003C7AD084
MNAPASLRRSRPRIRGHRGRRRTTRARGTIAAAALAVAVLAGCAGQSGPGDEEGAGAGQQPDAAESTEVTIGLTYIPDVQFAPFYLAQDAGYFEAEGLEVDLRHHGASESLFGALEAGEEDVVIAGNDEILQAVSHGTDVVSLATIYQDYPVQIFVPADSELTEVADLAGRNLGVPGPFGQSWFGLLGYLDRAGLSEDEVNIEHVGFTLFNALSEGHVDAVVGFVTADAAAFATADFPVRTIADPDVLPLVSVGLGASQEWLNDHSEAVPGLIRAVERAVDDIRADPQVAVDAASAQIPGTMTDQDEASALLTAEAMVELYGTGEFGAQDPEAWEEMAEFMDQVGLLDEPVPADEAYTTQWR